MQKKGALYGAHLIMTYFPGIPRPLHLWKTTSQRIPLFDPDESEGLAFVGQV